ncbi:MAG: response regulator [Chitinophagaceae bacterium]|nr:response regulator [Chitinophagaceae bacterium]
MDTHILLIDDDSDDAELFREALHRVDPSVSFVHFNDPRDFLDALQATLPKTPDVVFIDINMPVISGWELLEVMKKEQLLAGVPIIIYSTSSLRGEATRAQQEGADGFIMKPDDFSGLVELFQLTVPTLKDKSGAKLRRLIQTID